MLVLLAAAAFAADDPCYGHLWPDRIAGEHFWVEWNPEVADEATAQAMLEIFEASRALYVDQMGWRLTDRAIVIGLEANDEKGVSGQAQTRACDGEDVPILQLYSDDFREGARQTTASHELVHGIQYAYTGQWIGSAARAWWWMEGCATWLAVYGNQRPDIWAGAVGTYLGRSHLSLHHGLEAAFDSQRLSHMYGTALLAQVLDDARGPDAVRTTWEWAADHPDAPFWLPDVLADQGIAFDPFWAEYLARAATGDVTHGELVQHPPDADDTPTELPASGARAETEALGFQVVRFPKGLGQRRQALEVRIQGDDDARWHVVLAHVDERGPGSLVSYASAVVEGGGAVWLSDFRPGTEAALIVSPESLEDGAFPFTWSAALIDDPGPMDATVQLREPRRGGCSTVMGGGAGWLLLGLLAARRRSTARAS